MSDIVAALGEPALLQGFRLAGASIFAAETDDDVRAAWAAMPGNAKVVILTPRAAGALGAVLTDPQSPMTVVLPS
jgi:vacuolar-type H+-ATPase subunit F/Vma7